MRNPLSSLLLACMMLASFAVSPVYARNIVLTNDDGLTSNVLALYYALKAEGHDVIVSVPCQGQSGMGAAIKFLQPLGTLTTDCLHGAARKGDAGAGPMTRTGLPGDFYYVDGTPVMALLFGLDVLADARWGQAPDLILSGPNEGQNVGPMIITSGTVSNAQYGMGRGIPSIALSAGISTTGDQQLANPSSVEVANLTIVLLRKLEERSHGKRLLPVSLGLNVNFPDQLDKASWKLSRIGTFQHFRTFFAPEIGASSLAAQFGMSGVKLPGIALSQGTEQPTPSQILDESVVFRTNIAISAMQMGYEPTTVSEKLLKRELRSLFLK
jgi:5'-nucleotidase